MAESRKTIKKSKKKEQIVEDESDIKKTVSIPKEIYPDIVKYAKKDDRKVGPFLRVLVREALDARKAKDVSDQSSNASDQSE